jgi:ABC-type glycerol-3-phosphate transport system substrate-binding protein
LPEPAQKEALDFVEYLEQKSHQDDRLWSLNSLASALDGLESDIWPEYRSEDLKERWQ